MKKLLLKLSGEAYAAWTDDIYDKDALHAIATKILALRDAGYQIAIVTWWGNIWRWKDTQHLDLPRVTSDFLGMTATVMNAVVLSQTLEQIAGKWSAIAYSPQVTQIPTWTHPYSIHEAKSKLQSGTVVVYGWWTPLPFCTTDFTAVQRALELQCDVLVKATKVEGIYDKDPHKYSDAQKFDTITYDEVLMHGLEIMDQQAFALAKSQSLSLYVCHMDRLAMYGHDAIQGTYVVWS